jgi:hypothetical protein
VILISMTVFSSHFFIADLSPATVVALDLSNVILLCTGGTVALATHDRWLWRLMRRVRHFHTAGDRRLLLHFEPSLQRTEISSLLRRCACQLDDLAGRFGKPLRGRTVIYLFKFSHDIEKIRGAHSGGFAIWDANAIVIAANHDSNEMIRHEFTHLFSGRWSKLAPPLLCEGLSVYLQGSQQGQTMDCAARSLLKNRSLKLPLLLKRSFFFSEPHCYACYVLAGSFTQFLIRRYGWERYRSLYRRCNGRGFAAKFVKYLGITLEKAEWQWRNEIVITDILKRRMRSNVS